MTGHQHLNFDLGVGGTHRSIASLSSSVSFSRLPFSGVNKTRRRLHGWFYYLMQVHVHVGQHAVFSAAYDFFEVGLGWSVELKPLLCTLAPPIICLLSMPSIQAGENTGTAHSCPHVLRKYRTEYMYVQSRRFEWFKPLMKWH